MSLDLRADLIRLSHHFGADSDFVRAGGGNASVKENGILHIKASGTTLADLRGEDLVPLRIETLLEALSSDEPIEGDPVIAAAAKALVGDAGGRRPSVEILFHALIPDALVLHLHPLVANAVTCNDDGQSLAAKLLGDEAVWVDYIDPGIPLARGIAAARDEYAERTGKPAPAITMMGNHGIIVSGQSFDDVAERTTWLTDTIQHAISSSRPAELAEPQETPLTLLNELAEHFRRATGAQEVTNYANAFVGQTSDVSAGPVTRGPLIPDQIVYAGSLPVLLSIADDETAVASSVKAFRTQHGRLPIVAVVPQCAAFAVGATTKDASIALDTFCDALRVARDAGCLGSLRVMNERERHFIENWEAEAYRRSVSTSS